MNRFKIHLIILLIAAASQTLVLAAGQSDATQKQKSINWWTLDSGMGEEEPIGEYYRRLIAEYEEGHPGVRIDLHPMANEVFKKQIQLTVHSGNPPDLFHSWGGYVMFEFAKQGNLRDITYFVNSKLSKKINLETLNIYSYAGSYYGAPFDMGAVLMWYNRDIFQKAGVTIPKTWDEFLDTVRQLKTVGYTPISMGGKDRWPAHYWWVYLAMRIGGADAFNNAYGGTGSFRDNVFIEAGKKFKELIDLKPFQPDFEAATHNEQEGLFGDGKAAMELMGHWASILALYNAENGDAIPYLDVFPFPEVEGGRGKITDIYGGGNGFVVGRNAPDETLDLIDYLLSESIQRELITVQGVIPVVNSAKAGLSGYTAKIANIISKATYYQLYYDQFFPLKVGEALNDASLLLLNGTNTPEQTAAMIDNAWQNSK